MMASGGSPCADGDKASVTFEFACQPGTEGEPVLAAVEKDCDYTFVWKTKHACMRTWCLVMSGPTWLCCFVGCPGILRSSALRHRLSDGRGYAVAKCLCGEHKRIPG